MRGGFLDFLLIQRLIFLTRAVKLKQVFEQTVEIVKQITHRLKKSCVPPKSRQKKKLKTGFQKRSDFK